jgi:hypothetical protein
MKNKTSKSAQKLNTSFHHAGECDLFITKNEEEKIEHIAIGIKNYISSFGIDEYTKILVIVPNIDYAYHVSAFLFDHGFHSKVIEHQDAISPLTGYYGRDINDIYAAVSLGETIKSYSISKSEKQKRNLKKTISEIFDIEEKSLKSSVKSPNKKGFDIKNSTDIDEAIIALYSEILFMANNNTPPKGFRKLQAVNIKEKYLNNSRYSIFRFLKEFFNNLNYKAWEDVDIARIKIELFSPCVSIASFAAIKGSSDRIQIIDEIYILPFEGDNSTKSEHISDYPNIGELLDYYGAPVTYIF